MGLRDAINQRPWLGWVVAGVILGLAVLIYIRRSSSDSPYSPERMVQSVTIKYSDTGDEEQMPRGRFEKMLAEQPGKLDPAKGLLNPKTGQPTGFLYNKAEWEETCNRINAEKAAFGKGGQPAPAAPTPAPKPGK